jgi:hypothetical protein
MLVRWPVPSPAFEKHWLLHVCTFFLTHSAVGHTRSWCEQELFNRTPSVATTTPNVPVRETVES